MWSSYGCHINCYCPACKKTNKNGWWVGNCHVSWSKGHLVKKICQDIQAGAWGSQRLGSVCHDSASLRKSSHTFFFPWDRSNIFGIQNHLVYFGLAVRFWGRIGRIERRCTSFWFPDMESICACFLLHKFVISSETIQIDGYGKFEFNEVIKHKRCTCWVLCDMWYYATLWIVIMGLLTCFTPARKLFLYLPA